MQKLPSKLGMLTVGKYGDKGSLNYALRCVGGRGDTLGVLSD